MKLYLSLEVAVKMFFIKRIAAVTLVLTLIAGCDGDAFTSGGGRPPQTATTTVSFSVAGTASSNNMQVIDNSSSFILSWDVVSSSSYYFNVYISENSELGSSDIAFFSGQCGAGRACGDSADFECTFDNAAKTISCNGGGVIEVSSMLQAPSPQTTYLFLVVTNEMQDSTLSSTAQAVQFEY